MENEQNQIKKSIFKSWYIILASITGIAILIVGALYFSNYRLKKSISAKALTTVTDQACTYNNDETAYTPIRNNDSFGQTFTVSTIAKLTTVKLYLSAFPGDFDGSVQVTITRISDSHVFPGPSLNFGSNHMLYPWEDWYSFQFGALAPDVTPGQKYRINIINTSANWQQVFAIDNNLGYLNCNTSGAATESGVEKDYDFLFQVIGYLPESTGGNNNTGSNSITPTGSSSVSTRPASTTSATIKAPTNLAVIYEADKKDAKLTWGKSATANITGYRVFRSEQKTTGFSKIGEIKNNIFEYADANNLIAEKTYYYFVRAYKGSLESASSNTAELAIPKPIIVTPIPTISFNKTTFNNSTKPDNQPISYIFWVIGCLILILILIGLYILYRKIKKKLQLKKSE